MARKTYRTKRSAEGQRSGESGDENNAKEKEKGVVVNNGTETQTQTQTQKHKEKVGQDRGPEKCEAPSTSKENRKEGRQGFGTQKTQETKTQAGQSESCGLWL